MEDLSSFGTLVETAPLPPADLSIYGSPVVIKDNYEAQDSGEQSSIDKIKTIIGTGEALVGGAANMAGAGLDGIMNLMRTGVSKALDLSPGMSFGETFIRESQTRPQFGQKAADWMGADISPAGKAIQQSMGRIFEAPVKALGDSNYKRMKDAGGSDEAAAAMGAIGQGTATLAELLLGAGRATKPKDAPRSEYKPNFNRDVSDVQDVNIQLELKGEGALRRDYPNTAAAIDASKVGHENISSDVRLDGGNTHTLDIMKTAIDVELGITPASIRVNPALRDMPINAKLHAIIAKAAASQGEIVDTDTAQRYVDAAMKTMDDLSAVRDGPALPAHIEPQPTYVLDKPIAVDPNGVAMTAEQFAVEAQRVQNMTPENRAVEMGISPMGVMRSLLNDVKEAEVTATETNHPRDIAVYQKATADMTTQWNSMFDKPQSAAKRTDAMNEYASRAGDMSYDEAVRAVGNRNTGRGTFTIDTKWAEPLGEDVVRYAAAGIIKAATALGRPDQLAQMYRVTPPEGSTKLAPGAWLTDDGRFAQTYAATEGGTVTTHVVKISRMAEVSPGRYIYTPPGTPIGELIRFQDSAGTPIKFKDILPGGDAPAGSSGAGTGTGTGKKGKMGGKQKGMFVPPDEVGVKKAIDDLNRIRVGKPIDVSKKKGPATIKGKVLSNDAGRAQRAWDNNEKALAVQNKFSFKKTAAILYRGFFGHDRTLRDMLGKHSRQSEQALFSMTAESGYTASAAVYRSKVNDALFDNLTYKERKLLDQITMYRRISAIDIAKGEGETKHPDGMTGSDARARLAELKKEDPAAFAKADDGATHIFQEQRKLLDILEDGEIISAESKVNLSKLDYVRRKFVMETDPTMPLQSRVANMTKQQTSSGIPYLEGGSMETMSSNSKMLLNQDIIRAHAAVAKNKTLLHLRELAMTEPNDMVMPLEKDTYRVDENGDWVMKRTPTGWTSIGVRVMGKQEFFAMRDAYAEQFTSNMATDMSMRLSWVVSMLSLVKMIKATSTRYNPVFPIAGIPMDVLHVNMATQGVYSPIFPVYLTQMGKDMISVAGDVVKGGLLTQSALNNGMGSSLLVHEGLAKTYNMDEGLKANISDKVDKVKAGLAWVGERADMWVRVAHMKRLMDMGVPTADAAALAKMRMDGSIFGNISKVLDPVVPYFNIGMQASLPAYKNSILAMFKEGQLPFAIQDAKNAKLNIKGSANVIHNTQREAIIKVATMVASMAATVYSSMSGSPECWNQISTEDKIRNVNVCLGDDMYVVEDGKKRYMYMPVRLDATATPFMAGIIASMSEDMGHKVPEDMFTHAIGQVIPLADSWFPIVNAFMIVHGYNPRTDMSVGGNPNMNPEAQVRTFADKGGATDPAFIALGQVMNQNPVALQAAAKSAINTKNGYLAALNSIGELFGDERMEDIGKSNEQLFLQNPGVSSLVKLTTGNNEDMNALMKQTKAANTKHAMGIAEIKKLDYLHRNDRAGLNDIVKYIKTMPPEEQKALMSYAQHDLMVDKVAEKFHMGDGIPTKQVWVSASKAPDEARALWFYDIWISADVAKRQRMDGVAGSLGNGFAGDMFKYHLGQQKKKLGTEQR